MGLQVAASLLLGKRLLSEYPSKCTSIQDFVVERLRGFDSVVLQEGLRSVKRMRKVTGKEYISENVARVIESPRLLSQPLRPPGQSWDIARRCMHVHFLKLRHSEMEEYVESLCRYMRSKRRSPRLLLDIDGAAEALWQLNLDYRTISGRDVPVDLLRAHLTLTFVLAAYVIDDSSEYGKRLRAKKILADFGPDVMDFIAGHPKISDANGSKKTTASNILRLVSRTVEQDSSCASKASQEPGASDSRALLHEVVEERPRKAASEAEQQCVSEGPPSWVASRVLSLHTSMRAEEAASLRQGLFLFKSDEAERRMYLEALCSYVHSKGIPPYLLLDLDGAAETMQKLERARLRGDSDADLLQARRILGAVLVAHISCEFREGFAQKVARARLLAYDPEVWRQTVQAVDVTPSKKDAGQLKLLLREVIERAWPR